MSRQTRLYVLLAAGAALALGGLIAETGARAPGGPTRAALPAAGSPLAAARPVALAFEATVHEQIRAGGYRYLRVRDRDNRESWIATMGGAVAPHVTVRALARSERFHSRRLDRDFAPLLFAIVTDREPTTQEPRP